MPARTDMRPSFVGSQATLARGANVCNPLQSPPSSMYCRSTSVAVARSCWSDAGTAGELDGRHVARRVADVGIALVAQAQAEREVRPDLPVVLDERGDRVRPVLAQEVGDRAARGRVDRQIVLPARLVGREVEDAGERVDRTIEDARAFVVGVLGA